jgi:xenotropic and polytropic retrovirus receptor 1
LFAKYFEHNNRKHAVERLRSTDKPNENIPAVFHVGYLLGLSTPFLIEGLVNAIESMDNGSIPQAEYLMQVWGGFSLVILFLLLFGINCWVWTIAKINYTFIFEFDTKHHLDYRQYLEVPLPAFCSITGTLGLTSSYLPSWRCSDVFVFG